VKQNATLKRVAAKQPTVLLEQQVVRPPGQGQSKTAKRRRAQNKMGMEAMTMTSPVDFVSNSLAPQQAAQITRSTRLYSDVVKQAGKVTKDGLAFLKCAFAPADFDGTSTYGVPDDFGGKSLAVRFRNVASVNLVANTDYYFILAPVAGMSYFMLSKAAGVIPTAADAYTGVQYSNFGSLFPSASFVNQNASKFRMVSNHFELVSTTNSMSWTGNIQCFKLPLQAYLNNEGATGAGNNPDYWSISGLNQVTATDADMYSGAFNFGVYTGAFNRGAKFDFSPIWKQQIGLPGVISAFDFGGLTGIIPGFDNNMESVLIKITGVTTGQSCMIRSWSCAEFQFGPGNIMYDSQSLHVDCDKLAMAIYKKVSIELGAGVSALDNANFWERVLDIISKMGLAASVIPGPYGAVAGGVGALTAAIRELIM
jgi:hypothetical protein